MALSLGLRAGLTGISTLSGPAGVALPSAITVTLGAQVNAFNAQTTWGTVGNWTVAATGMKADGVTPMAVLYNRSNARIGVIEWNGSAWVSLTTQFSTIRSGNQDLLINQDDESATYWHAMKTVKIVDGLIVFSVAVGIPATSDNFTAVCYSTDYLASIQLARPSTGDYITPDRGSVAFGKLGASWNMTVEALPGDGAKPNYVRVQVADYEGHDGGDAQGGEWYRVDFERADTGTNNWVPKDYRRIHFFTGTKAHAHCALGDLLVAGDSADNQTWTYSVDTGFDNYDTGTITITDFEPQGRAHQPVGGEISLAGDPVMAVDVTPGIGAVYRGQTLGFDEGLSYAINANRVRGNDQLFIESFKGFGENYLYLSGYRATGNPTITALAQRQAVSLNGESWAYAKKFYETPVTAAGDFPKPLESSIFFNETGNSPQFLESDVIIKERSVIASHGPGGTNVVAGDTDITVVASGTAAAELIEPGAGGYYYRASISDDPGTVMPYQPPGDGPCYYLKASETEISEDIILRFSDTQAAGDYIAKLYIARPNLNASEMRIQLREQGAASNTIYIFGSILPRWETVYVYASMVGTHTPEIVIDVRDVGGEGLVQIAGLFNQKLVPVDAPYATASVAAQTYSLALPATSGTGIVRARVKAPTEAYGLSLASSGEVVLLQTIEDANNYFELTYTPSATPQNAGTYTLREVVAGVSNATDTVSGYLNAFEDISLAVSYDSGTPQSDVKIYISSGDVLELTSTAVIPVTIEGGDVQLDILQADTTDADVLTAAELEQLNNQELEIV